MNVELTHEQVVSECLKFHGWGEFFPRTDGLEHEAGREAARRQFLDEHRDTRPEHADAILRAAVTPGMKKEEVSAAWGLTHSDARDVYGHLAVLGGTSYSCFTGFRLGESYAVCLIGELIVGVRRCDEVLIVRDHELEEEVARHYFNYAEFFDTGKGHRIGRAAMETVDFNIWLHVPGAYEGLVPPYSTDPSAVEDLEGMIRREGRFAEYVGELARLGADLQTATPPERCRAAIEVARARKPREEEGI